MGFGGFFQPTHLLFILVIALLVLGPKRLPEVAKTLGRGLRDFKEALSTDDLDWRHESAGQSNEEPEVRHELASQSTEAHVEPATSARPAGAPASIESARPATAPVAQSPEPATALAAPTESPKPASEPAVPAPPPEPASEPAVQAPPPQPASEPAIHAAD